MPELNDEQRLISEYVIQGKTNFEIANAMGYSVPSVKRKLKKIYELCRVDGRLGLVRYLAETLLDNPVWFGI